MKSEVPFANRSEAGILLGQLLRKYTDHPEALVLALPRGGVPVGVEIARLLRIPFDVFLVRKLGVPHHEELAMGAIASGGVRVLNEDLISQLGITSRMIESAAAEERNELERRELEYRHDRPPIDVRERIVILVDDGLATGASMRAAVQALRERQPKRIVVAVPVGAAETCEQFESEVEEVVCARCPEFFGSVGSWYEDFSQTTDAEVRQWLQQAADFAELKRR